MNQYLATFHTHLSAMLSCQALTNDGISVRMMPVPRKLSSSCGTCIRYEAPSDCRALLDSDLECLYRVHDAEYVVLLTCT